MPGVCLCHKEIDRFPSSSTAPKSEILGKYLNNYIIYHNIVNFKKSSIEATEQIINKLTRNTKFNILFSAVQDRPAIPL